MTAQDQQTEPTKVAAAQPNLRDRWFVRYSGLGIPAALVVIVIVFAAIIPDVFLTVANLGNILGSQAVLVIIALGLLFPMVGGDFDLSVASMAALSAMIVTVLNVQLHWNAAAAVIAALLTGLAVGLANGSLIVGIGIDPFIATLGTATVLDGIVLWISGSNTISGLSPSLVDVVTKPILRIPAEFYIGLLCTVAAWYVIEYTPFGRRLIAVGQGRLVAELNGIRVGRTRWTALIISGVLASLGGVLYAGVLGGAGPIAGQGYLLPAFAAVFLGATTIRRGRFNPWGSFLSVYFLITGITGLELLGVPNFVQDLFYGGALVIAVSFAFLAAKAERS